MGPTDLAELTIAPWWTDDGNGAITPGAGNDRAVHSRPAGDLDTVGGSSESAEPTDAATDGNGDTVARCETAPRFHAPPETRALGESAVGSGELRPAATHD
ncbi:hypothetical protein [Haloarcula pelagica]|uniref:hypothetical protein n=1 Tax=Haloarcula pelagica TaxID=3033389 RepID=UPI0024C2BE81|nr:hypothetical protein [Halomicroarcula sp. YJ-61-S]